LLLDKGIPRTGYEIQRGLSVVGKVSSGSYSPVLERGIGIGYIKTHYARKGAILGVKIRGRLAKAEVLKMPGSFISKAT
jgi:aminomethyltransferase